METCSVRNRETSNILTSKIFIFWIKIFYFMQSIRLFFSLFHGDIMRSMWAQCDVWLNSLRFEVGHFNSNVPTSDLDWNTTQTLGCCVWPKIWVTHKLPKHWVVTFDPGAGPDSTPDSTSRRRLFDVCIYICKTYFLECLLICNMSIGRFLLDVK